MNSKFKSKDIIVRRATLDDDFSEIAKLIYKTDEYIYHYWFSDSMEECQEALPPLMKEDGFFYNYKFMYVAYDTKKNKIVGLVSLVTPDGNLEYDYSKLKSVNDRYSFTIDNYVMQLIKEVKDFNLPYFSNVCVDEESRGKHIGHLMLDYVIKDNIGKYEKLLLDVLSDNPAAIRLYQNLDFQITSPETMGIGYGPDDFVGQYSMELDCSKDKIM